MKQQTINISGMSCSGCADMIAENLSQLSGVQNVTVHLNENSAAVKYNPDEVTLDDFKRTIEDTGYGFKGVK